MLGFCKGQKCPQTPIFNLTSPGSWRPHTTSCSLLDHSTWLDSSSLMTETGLGVPGIILMAENHTRTKLCTGHWDRPESPPCLQITWEPSPWPSHPQHYLPWPLSAPSAPSLTWACLRDHPLSRPLSLQISSVCGPARPPACLFSNSLPREGQAMSAAALGYRQLGE